VPNSRQENEFWAKSASAKPFTTKKYYFKEYIKLWLKSVGFEL
jgi:hypothetical protein